SRSPSTPHRHEHTWPVPVTALRTVTVDGSPVHVLESGTGPAVLILHRSGPGTTGSGAWATTAQALATGA
ncbi:hypothetical protein ACFYYP_40585, partial [Microbispora rosea]